MAAKLVPKPDANFMQNLRRYGPENSFIGKAGSSIGRIAARKHLPTLLKERETLLQPPARPLTTVVKDLEPSDRSLLLDQFAADLSNVVDEREGDPLVDKDEVTAEMGEEVLAQTPQLHVLSPGFSWIVAHRKELEEHLPDIIKECVSEDAPRLTESIRQSLAYYDELRMHCWVHPTVTDQLRAE